MRVSLRLHPDCRPGAAEGIEVALSRPGPARLDLRYAVTGEIGRIRIPPPAVPGRADGLWKHSCFEAFVAVEGGSYCEFNFSPSGQWAAWRFEAYRCGLVQLATEPPRIVAGREAGSFRLDAAIALPSGARRIGLSAVIEDMDGTLSYWALAHPPGRPDFHDPACFALDLPPPAAA